MMSDVNKDSMLTPAIYPALGADAFISLARFKLMLSMLMYALALMYGHAKYLAVEQAFWGFNVPSFSIGAIFCILVFTLIPCFVLPLRFTRPSSIFIYALAFCVYVPSLVIGMLNHSDSVDRYFWIFLSFCGGLVLCSLIVRSLPFKQDGIKMPSSAMLGICMAGSFISFILLFFTYRDVLSFSGVDDIYAQRERGAATSLFIGYCQVYLAYFFSPILFVAGWVARRYIIALIGFAGFVFVFMITAERTVFLFPFALVLIAFIFKRRGENPNNPAGLFALGGVMVLLIASFYAEVGLFRELGFYFYTRLIAYPGLFVTQYYDLFSEQGFTNWSHVSVIGRLADIPSAYANDEKWPALGKILAERVLGVQSQSNASFIATDGVAAQGGFGVLVIFMLYTGWLVFLDRVSQGWNRIFLLTVLFPLAFVTTNGPFFTMLTSFGGALWIALLWFDKLRFRL